MAKNLNELESELNAQLDKLEQLVVFCRDSSLQRQIKESIPGVQKGMTDAKSHFKVLNDEFACNLILTYELLVQAFDFELSMVLQLKDGDPDCAWDQLISAQNVSAVAARICPKKIKYTETCVQRLDKLEYLLFPEQLFISIGAITESSICSICKADYADCNHLRGQAYMGEICTEIFEEAIEVLEVSLVDHPADKRCRQLYVGEGEGEESYNWLSLKPRTEEEQNKQSA